MRERIWFGMLFLMLVAGLGGCAATGPAQAAGRWRLIGERTVNGRVDHDVIEAGPRDGVFQRLQVTVKGSAVELYELRIVFGNGEELRPDTRFVFRRGSWSRVIDLPGNNRVIRRVEFRYGNLPGGGHARIRLFGS